MTDTPAEFNPAAAPRHDWQKAELETLYALPFGELLFRAQQVHRHWWPADKVQKCTLLSVKTGGCPEDCAYCAQSIKYKTGLKASKLMAIAEVKAGAKRAKAGGASRYCMGAAWRDLKDRDIPALAAMIKAVQDEGMESCMTLGMLTKEQAHALKEAGLDYYNHNIDTSPEFYDKIITTREFGERLETLDHVREAGIKVCCGGILGMGEQVEDRLEMLRVLANLPEHPESVPINKLIPIKGTPLGDVAPVEGIEFARLIAVARIMMPRSVVRLSAGREGMSAETQALCFLAGANSIFIGEKLLTAKNPEREADSMLFEKLGIEAMPAHQEARAQEPAE